MKRTQRRLFGWAAAAVLAAGAAAFVVRPVRAQARPGGTPTKDQQKPPTATGGDKPPKGTAGDKQPPVFAAGVEIVALDIAVVDKDGRPVPNLTAADFEL